MWDHWLISFISLYQHNKKKNTRLLENNINMCGRISSLQHRVGCCSQEQLSELCQVRAAVDWQNCHGFVGVWVSLFPGNGIWVLSLTGDLVVQSQEFVCFYHSILEQFLSNSSFSWNYSKLAKRRCEQQLLPPPFWTVPVSSGKSPLSGIAVIPGDYSQANHSHLQQLFQTRRSESWWIWV